MDDRHDPNLILGYVEDELTAADRARVDALIAEDPALASLIADFQRHRDALRAAPPLEPPVDLTDGAIAALERQMLFEDASPHAATPALASRSRFRLAPLLTYGGIAAVLVITVTVVFESLLSAPSPSATVAMNDAPPQGMSLAEATLEAQRKAAMSQELAARETDSFAGDADAALSPRRDAASSAKQGVAPALVPPPTEALADASETLRSSEGNIVFSEDLTRQRGRRGETPVALTQANDRFADATSESESDFESRAEPADTLAESQTSSPHPSLSAAANRRRNSTTPPAPIAPAAPPPLAPPFAAAENKTASTITRPAPANPAIQRYTLNVVTASPDGALRQLRDWASNHNIAIISASPAPAFAPLPARSVVANADITAEVAADAVMLEASAEPPQALDAAPLTRRADLLQWQALAPADRHRQDTLMLADGDASSRPQRRLQLTIDPTQVRGLVAALSSPRSTPPQDLTPRLVLPPVTTAIPGRPWMNWQVSPRWIGVDIVIEAWPESPSPADVDLP